MSAPGLLVNIDVDDLARATRFYTSAFGLNLGRRFGDGGIELLGAAVPIYLLVKPAGSKPHAGDASAARTYARHWTPVHLDFVVDDLPTAIDCAVAAGAALEEPMRTAAWGPYRALCRSLWQWLLPAGISWRWIR